MSSASNTTPAEDSFSFNDMSTNTTTEAGTSKSPKPADTSQSVPDSNVPKPKRIACVICRKRKLKCDGSKPKCYTCTRLGHNCAYDEVRKKSGPKRGYVKALEERLKHVETLLKTQEPVTASQPTEASTSFQASSNTTFIPTTADMNVVNPSVAIASDRDQDRWRMPGDSPQPILEDVPLTTGLGMDTMGINDTTFTWEMIGLGLEEPLPPQETVDELHKIYFEKIHPSVPMIHRYRYLAAMNLAPNQRPPVALRYAMWMLAASVTDKYINMHDHFYQRARKYMEADTMKGHGEHIISIAHAQTHILLASYEFKMMNFPRAWVSTGSAVRLCQMMGLHRLDGEGLDVKQCLPAPRDWTEREERRRTFWMAFCEDRYASIGTGWPISIDERDILTNLPASDEAFEKSKPETTTALSSSMSTAGASKLSAFGSVVLMACLFGRNLLHLHRPDANDRDYDLNGEFWKRHRHMDNILLNVTLSLPPHLKLPQGINNPNIVFTNMNIHTSTICLHQAAIFKADKNKLTSSISAESKIRCLTAANEIASIMRMISHLDLSTMNPFISFCLYVAARVYVQYLKSRPEDSQTADSLRFLLTAMNALKRKNALTESFLVQLDVDLESLGVRHAKFSTTTAIFDERKTKIHHCRPHLHMAPDTPPEDGDQPPSQGQTQGSFSKANDISFDWLQEGMAPRNPETHPVGMQGILLGQGTGESFDSSRTYHGRMGGYGPTGDNSPHAGQTSNRPTPNSTSPSETQSNMQGTQQVTNSSRTSHDASPASTSQNQQQQAAETNSFYNTTYGPITGADLTSDDAFQIPQTPAGWEPMGNTGLTPIGEGVFSQLMGMGPMDLGWEGNS